jgi:hypothetical protein
MVVRGAERVPTDSRGCALRPMHRHRFRYGRSCTIVHDAEKARHVAVRMRPGSYRFAVASDARAAGNSEAQRSEAPKK